MSTPQETSEEYDIISLGSGEGGKLTAWHYASQGKRCAIIETRWYGGSCPNIACMPSKNVLWYAKFVHAAASISDTVGVETKGVDFGKVIEAKRAMVKGQVNDHKTLFEHSGLEFIWGQGRLSSPGVIEVTDDTGRQRYLKGKTIVICTGSRALIPSIPGMREASPLTHIELLELDTLPEHLLIIGGGYVALEFAQAFRRFGARVTVVEHNDRILKREDPEVSALMLSVLEREGVKVFTSATPRSISGTSGKGVTLTLALSQPDSVFEIQASHVLCAAGRVPNTEGIGLENVGVELTSAGHIKVDEQMRTTASRVFASGDCAGSPYFTHMGFDDFRIVRDAIAGDKLNDIPDRRSARQVPSVLFTDPELAHVGLHEWEAKAKDIPHRVFKIPMTSFLRAHTMGSGETTGFAKALVHNENDTIIGFTAVGANAGELLPVVQLAMKKTLPFSDLADLIIAHPTFNEGLTYLFSMADPSPRS